MIFGGRILDPKGAALATGLVEIVMPKGSEITLLARGKIDQGRFSLEADPGPVWGLRIDGRPVAATVASSDGATADLGDIGLVADGIAWPMFHARDGRVFGVPTAARPSLTSDGASGDTSPPPPPTTTDRVVATRTGLTFGGLLGSSARQLTTVATAVKGLSLAGANITIKGVPTATEDAIGLDFPNAELAAAGTGLSELSFVFRPTGDTEPSPQPPTPVGPTVPDVRGYTRELALRKLAALRMVAEARDEITSDATKVGRVVRQFPAPGTAVDAATPVRIFVGKQGAA
jgi:hypothetical protein